MDLSPVVIVKARVNTISRVLSDKWNFFHFETREFNQLQPTHPGTLNSLEVAKVSTPKQHKSYSLNIHVFSGPIFPGIHCNLHQTQMSKRWYLNKR
jgi:hypothetical protein